MQISILREIWKMNIKCSPIEGLRPPKIAKKKVKDSINLLLRQRDDKQTISKR